MVAVLGQNTVLGYVCVFPLHPRGHREQRGTRRNSREASEHDKLQYVVMQETLRGSECFLRYCIVHNQKRCQKNNRSRACELIVAVGQGRCITSDAYTVCQKRSITPTGTLRIGITVLLVAGYSNGTYKAAKKKEEGSRFN